MTDRSAKKEKCLLDRFLSKPYFYLFFTFIAVRANDLKKVERALCGLDAPAPHPEKDRVQEALMVMAFFDRGLMDQLLKELRANGQTVRLKAVLTPHNRRWTCGALCRHLSLEAAQMGR